MGSLGELFSGQGYGSLLISRNDCNTIDKCESEEHIFTKDTALVV